MKFQRYEKLHGNEEQWRKLSLLNFEMNNLLHLPRAVELWATTN